MNSSGQRARDLFVAALRLTPEQWDEFLRRECADDTALHDRAKALLRAHAEAGSFLDRPAAAPVTDTQTAADDPGEVVGPYKLLEVIGEGGMGTVWMAEQTAPVRRLVALKLVKPGLDSRPVLARFEAERQALALMDHPNIAKVLDAGTTHSGRPYFVMELVKGVPITTYCDAHRLTPRQRLELFIPVCEAIQHAHQKGIIHRDVKPSNVLVARYDDNPMAKVIDFGVAKAVGGADGLTRLTERTLHTSFGAVVGTVEYMSPEQASFNQLDVDTRSDIYSLGVLLYELLTGGPPFGRAEVETVGLLETLRLIREQDPPRPSTRLSTADGLPALASNRGTEPKRLAALVRGELDWIVMKALEKDRNRRYATAHDLALDLRRYLANEPVAAGPPGRGYRVRKFVRRHRGPVAAAAAVLLSLVGGITGTAWGLVGAKHARQAESERAQGESLAKIEAQSAATAAKAAQVTAEKREAETTAVLKFVENQILSATRPKGQAGGLGGDVSLRQAIKAAVPFVDGSFAKEPVIEARLRMTLGSSFVYLGETKSATEQLLKARTLYSQQLGPDHPDTLRCANNLAATYRADGRFAEALRLNEETLALRRAKLGPEHTDTLWSCTALANSYEDLGRDAEALRLREETLAVQQRKFGRDHPDTLMSMNNLANSYIALRRYDEALRLHEETFARRKATLGPDHPDTLVSMLNVGSSYRHHRRHADALRLYEETLARQKLQLDPDHPHLLLTMSNVAISYADQGRHEDALRLRTETLALRERKLGPDHPDTLMSMNHLANSYAVLGRHEEALRVREELLTRQTTRLGADHPDTLQTMSVIARILVRLDRGADAVLVIDDLLKLASGQASDSTLIAKLIDVRLRHFQKVRDAAGCRTTAEMWENQGRGDADGLYNAACYRAVTSAVIRDSDPSVTGAGQANAEADRAMEWLKRAVAAGYKDVANMTKDNDIDALRGREDFRALLKELGAAAQKK